MIQATVLHNRGVLRLRGVDRAAFLQGLVSNDVHKITPGQGIYAALLSPQGKFQYDMFIGAMQEAFQEDTWIIDCDCNPGPERADMLLKRLSLYKLRSQVTLENLGEKWAVLAIWGTHALKIVEFTAKLGAWNGFVKGLAFADPRLKELGIRLIVSQDQIGAIYDRMGARQASFADYDLHRLELGVPDGSRDILADRGIPLECGLDELNAIDWNKGCYMGQELTARTRYRGLVRKRLMPVKVDGTCPAFQAPVFQGEKEVGEMRTSLQGRGLALLRLESLSIPLPFRAGDAIVVPEIPAWMRLPVLNEKG